MCLYAHTMCAYIKDRWNFEILQEFKSNKQNELENVYLNYLDIYIALDSCVSLQIGKYIKCHHKKMFEVDSFKECLSIRLITFKHNSRLT